MSCECTAWQFTLSFRAQTMPRFGSFSNIHITTWKLPPKNYLHEYLTGNGKNYHYTTLVTKFSLLMTNSACCCIPNKKIVLSQISKQLYLLNRCFIISSYRGNTVWYLCKKWGGGGGWWICTRRKRNVNEKLKYSNISVIESIIYKNPLKKT